MDPFIEAYKIILENPFTLTLLLVITAVCAGRVTLK